MKARRFVAGLSATILALSAMSVTAFAEEIEFEIDDTAEVADADVETLDDNDLAAPNDLDLTEEDELTADELVEEDIDEDDNDEFVVDGDADGDNKETTDESFKAEIADADIVEKDVEGEDGWREYTVPTSAVTNFPKGKAVKVTIDYTKRRSYYSTQERVISTGHDVTKANVAFVIDRTSSMSDKIQAVKTNLTLVVNTLKERNIDVSFAVIDYTNDSYGGITFHDINGEKWSKDYNAVISVLDSLDDMGGTEYPFAAYEKLFTETPNWYTSADANFVFLLTDEDSDDYNSSSNPTTSRSMAEWVSYLDDLGIYNTVVTTSDLNNYYKALYEGTGGQVLDIRSKDYGQVMADFASHVEDRVTHTVVYENYKTTIVGGDGKVIVHGLTNGETAYDVTGSETGTIELVVSAADAEKYFAEDPNNPGYTNFKIKDFGLDITKISFEAIEDPKEETVNNKPDDHRPVNPVINPGTVYYPVCEPVKEATPNPGERAKVSPYVAALPADSSSTASSGPIAATGGVYDAAEGTVPMAAAGVVGALAVIAAGVLVVLNKKKQH